MCFATGSASTTRPGRADGDGRSGKRSSIWPPRRKAGRTRIAWRVDGDGASVRVRSSRQFWPIIVVRRDRAHDARHCRTVNDFGTRVRAFGDRTAIIDPAGTWTYEQLDADARRLAGALLDGAPDLGEGRVAVLCTPGHDYVTALLACWAAGAIAVPLHPEHPEPEQAYVVEHSGATVVVASTTYEHAAQKLA